MPFTLSHPAAVLPLIVRGRGRGPLVASALVAGSVAPDMPYFADSAVPGVFGFGAVTHAWWGVPTVDVLIAAVLAGLWHGLLRVPLLALLPARWAGAPDAPAPARSAGTAGAFAVSAALGAATHVGWDAFTHHDRAGVRLLPVLDRTVIAGQPLYTVLQYGSSAVALCFLARWLVRELRRRAAHPGPGTGPRTGPGPVQPLGRRARTAALGAVAAAAAAGTALRIDRWSGLRAGASPYELIPTVAFGSLAGAGAALLGYAIVHRLTGGKGLARRYGRAA
ncbi:hypothetical protein KNE206_16520 [Kitasatospora sp. NE20-6]|uniref:DUF4184 family protein n=1 Tax=Kitasatospora sp. NE20-6 TaxID=2859066 RepID=UPI0034DC606F